VKKRIVMGTTQTTQKIHISSEITEKIKVVYFKYLVFLSLFGFTFMYFYFGLSLELFSLTSLMLVVFAFFRYIYNDFVDLSVMGEYMIIKKSDNKNLIAPINKIKKCKSKRFLNFVLTSFEFNLDGAKRKVFFVSSDEKMSMFNNYRSEQSFKVA
jgi:hypothetical protein